MTNSADKDEALSRLNHLREIAECMLNGSPLITQDDIKSITSAIDTASEKLSNRATSDHDAPSRMCDQTIDMFGCRQDQKAITK